MTFGSWPFAVLYFSLIVDFLVPFVLSLDFYPKAGGGNGVCLPFYICLYLNLSRLLGFIKFINDILYSVMQWNRIKTNKNLDDNPGLAMDFNILMKSLPNQKNPTFVQRLGM